MWIAPRGVQQILLPVAGLGGMLLVALGCCLNAGSDVDGQPRIGPETGVSETA